MEIGCVVYAIYLTCVCTVSALAQERASASEPCPDPTLVCRQIVAVKTSISETIPLTVRKGTAVQVVLEKEVRIQRIGQSVYGRVAEPVYAFDKLVVPVGTEVTGKITQLEGVSGARRALGALNADFTPARKVQLEFDDLELSWGTAHSSVYSHFIARGRDLVFRKNTSMEIALGTRAPAPSSSNQPAGESHSPDIVSECPTILLERTQRERRFFVQHVLRLGEPSTFYVE